MPIRREEVEWICRYLDEQLTKNPPSEAERKRIRHQVGKVVAANNLIQASAGIEKLSDETVTILITSLSRR